ncbi:MAG: lysylphosphatidylglycerol synthase transmembrane domain-containing protein [Bacteroidota bacterium]
MQKNTLISLVKYLLGVGLGVLLLYLVFKDASLEQLIADVRAADPAWLLGAIGIGLLSHWFRGLRWRMQLRAANYSPSPANTFAAVMFMYMVNLALPRAGELARCSILLRSDKIPIPTSLGTVVTSRVLDLVILIILILLAMVLEFPKLIAYLDAASSGSSGGNTLLILGGIVVVGLVVLWFFRNQLLRIPLVAKLWNFAKEMGYAALSIRKVESPFLFVVYTIIIWFCYYLMTYLAMRSMPPVANLDVNLVYFSLIVTIMGGIGMAIPVPGGIGPYHAAVTFTFVAFSVLPDPEATKALGQSFAVVMHTSQLIMMIVVGSLSYLFLILKPARDSILEPAFQATSSPSS